jgi:hypothetical protein
VSAARCLHDIFLFHSVNAHFKTILEKNMATLSSSKRSSMVAIGYLFNFDSFGVQLQAINCKILQNGWR